MNFSHGQQRNAYLGEEKNKKTRNKYTVGNNCILSKRLCSLNLFCSIFYRIKVEVSHNSPLRSVAILVLLHNKTLKHAGYTCCTTGRPWKRHAWYVGMKYIPRRNQQEEQAIKTGPDINSMLLDVLAWMATLATIGFHLTGLIDCKKIIDRQSSGATPFLPFLTTHFCCGLWLCYGIMKADPTVKFVNAAGMGLSAIYMVCYISYSSSKSRQLTLVIIAMATAMGMEYYLVQVIKDKKVRADYLGLACIITTILMQASPLFSVVTVLKTKSTETMQYFFCLMMTVVSLIWFTYGYLLQDSTIMAPNISGVMLGVIQLSMFLIFPSKPSAKKTN